jgi:hypothetical protein
MAEPKTQKSKQSVSSFLDSVKDQERRADCKTIVRLMERATRSKGQVWTTGFLGFGERVQKYADGSERRWMRMALAPRKDRITVYLNPEFPGRDELLSKLGKYKSGKSCIHIKRLAEVDVPTLKKLIGKSVKAKSAR